MTFEIRQGNSLDVLMNREVPQVDCIITDPPYGETSLDWDRRTEWLLWAKHLLKPCGSIWFFTSLKHLLSLDLSEWNVAQEVIWEKHNGSNFHADRFRRVHELIVQLYPRQVRWSDIYKSVVTTPDATKKTVRRKKRPTHTGYIESGSYTSEDGGPRLARSVIRVRSCHGYAEHPTQKPLQIIEPLIEYSCPPDGLILDPFSGSGSIGVAAVSLGRQYIGIERNPDFVEVAKRRLQEVQAHLFI